MNRLYLAAGALLLGGCATVQANRADTITKIESREQPSETVTQTVMAQLADILLLQQQRSNPRRPPTRPLTDLWFWTRPQAANFSGLCEATQVQVSFLPVGPSQGPDTEVRVSRIDTRSFYRALTSPSEIGTHEIEAADEAACAQLAPDSTIFFEADDATAARYALVLADLMRRQPEDLDVQCAEQASHCAAELQTALSGPISHVHQCGRPDSSHCYTLYTPDWAITVEAALVATPTAPLRWRIDRVRVAEIIVLGHERID